jgi:protein-S-isoprenylcysteine O-methyltransferase Ste14
MMTVPIMICVLACIFGLIGYLIVQALELPARLGMPSGLHIAGLIVLFLGFLFMGWLYRYRKPIDILVSTYVTMLKTLRQAQPTEASSRTEPLVLVGPQRHVRHPLYFAVVVLLFGWWLFLDYTLLLFMAAIFFLWFNLVVIRFEEKELIALYGEEYKNYMKTVPRFFPSLKSRWHR